MCYTDTGTTTVLPERQAMAAMEAKRATRMSELLLVYLDTGAEMVTAWGGRQRAERSG